MLIFYKRITSKDKRIFFAYALFTTTLILLVGYFLQIEHNKSYYFLTARFHTVFEFSLLTYLFSNAIKSKIFSKIPLFLIPPFIILCVLDYTTSKEPSLAFVPLFTECLFFLIIILFFFFEKINQDATEPIFTTFIFWCAVAFLINFSGNFMLFVYSKTTIIKDDVYKTNYAVVYSTVTVIKNILLCIAASIKEPIVSEKINLSNPKIFDINFDSRPDFNNPEKI